MRLESRTKKTLNRSGLSFRNTSSTVSTAPWGGAGVTIPILEVDVSYHVSINTHPNLATLLIKQASDYNFDVQAFGL